MGRDPKMRQLFRLIGDIAASDTTVLIEGETGTGKELFAEEIHRASPRRDGPFVVFDCGAVPRELIESALFGHVRGAFTGAFADRRGAFAEADGGTLFLDEIGELALEVQPALLRALDKRAVRPVGGQQPQSFSVRVVAATNRDLRSEVAARRFREDLYYRLAVFRLAVPPLRERPDDVPLLVRHFVADMSGGRLQVRTGDLQRLAQHAVPRQRARAAQPGRARLRAHQGRQRGQHHRLRRASWTPTATPRAPTPGAVAYDLPFKQAKAQIVDQFERDYLERLMDHHHHNLRAAARAADSTASTCASCCASTA